MLKIHRRLEKLERTISLHDLSIETTVYFIDFYGVVQSLLRLLPGEKRWIKGTPEVARAEW